MIPGTRAPLLDEVISHDITTLPYNKFNPGKSGIIIPVARNITTTLHLATKLIYECTRFTVVLTFTEQFVHVSYASCLLS